jgi:hypothetical protein
MPTPTDDAIATLRAKTATGEFTEGAYDAR